MKPFEFSILLLGLTLSACASTQSGERATNQTLPLPEPMQWRDEGLTASSIRFNAPSERHSYHFTDDFSGAKVHGSGRYRYRMVLQDPKTPAKPLRMQDYALSHDEIDLPFVADEKDVFQGTTDSEGRTDVFAFDAPLNPNRWRLRPRVGSGPYGEQFVLRQSHDNSVLDKFPYLLLVCDDCVFHPNTTTHSGPNPASDSGRNPPPAPLETLPPVPIQSRPPIPKQTRHAGGLM